MSNTNNNKIPLALSKAAGKVPLSDLEQLGLGSMMDPNADSNHDDDEDSYDEQQELATLVAASVKQSRVLQQQNSPVRPAGTTSAAASPGRSPPRQKLPPRSNQGLMRRLFGSRKSLRLMALVLGSFFVLYVILPSGKSASDGSVVQQKKQKTTNANAKPRYTCPASNTDTSDNALEDFDTWQSTFRERAMNPWGHTYAQIKGSRAEWIWGTVGGYLLLQQAQQQNTTTTTTIYDASLGVGLDLLMVLEILHERQASGASSSLTVYGSGPSSQNLDKRAKPLLTQYLPKFNVKGGKLCAASVLQLKDFIPSTVTFNVVSAHIAPLPNPLKFDTALSPADLERRYTALCAAQPTAQQQDQLQQAQKAQRDHYQTYAQALLRLVPPGGLVVLRDLSLPLCQNLHDLGGVAVEFWNSTTTTSAWAPQVDLASVQFQTDGLVPQRYHVAFRTKQQQ